MTYLIGDRMVFFGVLKKDGKPTDKPQVFNSEEEALEYANDGEAVVRFALNYDSQSVEALQFIIKNGKELEEKAKEETKANEFEG